MAAFAAVVDALHVHLTAVSHRIKVRKEAKAEQEGRRVRRALAPPCWSFVACELVRLLQQFPSGVSEAVMYTHIVERWSAQARCSVFHSCLERLLLNEVTQAMCTLVTGEVHSLAALRFLSAWSACPSSCHLSKERAPYPLLSTAGSTARPGFL